MEKEKLVEENNFNFLFSVFNIPIPLLFKDLKNQ